ncbi:MAG: hypothetical protein Kow0068_03920 [Marinilabiliales bacterium]
MKKQSYKILLTGLLIAFFAITGQSQELERKIQKEFIPKSNTKLVIKNHFGDIKIQDWEQQKIVVDITIKTKAGSETTAANMMKKITIDFKSSDSLINIITLVDKNIHGTGIFRSSNREFSIDYVVSVPRNLKMDLYNKYGDIIANELHGKSNFTVKFGNFKANKLLFDDSKPLSKVVVSYGKCTINECNWLSCIMSFSKLNIAKSKAIVIVSKYSELNLSELVSAVIESAFDNYNIDNISSVVFNSKYSDMTISKLSQRASFDSKFGNIKLENIVSGFDSIKITSKYVDFDLYGEEGSTFFVQGKIKYGDIDFPKYTNLERYYKESYVEFKGLVGPGEGTESHIDIDASFGDFKIK